MMGTIRRVTRNVKRWRDAGMALRWVAAGMIEANKGFRRLKAHKQLSVLRAALQAHHDRMTIKPGCPRHEGRVTFTPATSARRSSTPIGTSPFCQPFPKSGAGLVTRHPGSKIELLFPGISKPRGVGLPDALGDSFSGRVGPGGSPR